MNDDDDGYRPCRNGIHVCGVAHIEAVEIPVTLANLPGKSERVFDALETHFALRDDEPDLIVDLMIDGDIVRDFGIRRQSLDALLQSAAAMT